MTPSATRPLVGIVLFDEVEMLDFAGPYEVFTGTMGPDGRPYVDVVTIGPSTEVIARGGLWSPTQPHPVRLPTAGRADRPGRPGSR